MDLRRFIEIGLKKNFVWVSRGFFFSQNKKSFLGFLKSSKLKIKKEKKIDELMIEHGSLIQLEGMQFIYLPHT